MIHPQDFADYQAMTGNAPIPDGFEREYVKWLRMQHRRKRSGPLGDLLVPLCRQFGLEPPDGLVTDGRSVDWRNVRRGQRLVVTIDRGDEVKENVGGEFRGLGAHNTVSVVLDGDTWVREFPPHSVTLDYGIPADVKLPKKVEEQVLDAEREKVSAPSFVIDEELAPAVSTAVKAQPTVKNRRFLSLLAGTRLNVAINDDFQDATFVEVGPNDYEITVSIEGEPDPIAVSEEMVDIA